MKINFKLFIVGLFFIALPFIYKNFGFPISDLTSLFSIIIFIIGASFISTSLIKKNKYKVGDIKSGVIFEIKSIYKTPWESRIGISFNDKKGQYQIHPIPEDLMNAYCGEKYCKQKNKIVKIQ